MLPAQTVVDGQFVSRAPGILSIEEITVLSLYRARLSGRPHIAVHVAHFREKERSQVHPAGTVAVAGALPIEMHLTGAVGVGRNAQVGGVAQIGTELELVVAKDLCPVVNVLITLFLLDQRAVTAGNVEGFAKSRVGKPVAAVWNSIEKQTGQPVRGYVGRIQTGESQCRGCVCAVLVELRRMRIVTEVSKPEVGQERAAQRGGCSC